MKPRDWTTKSLRNRYDSQKAEIEKERMPRRSKERKTNMQGETIKTVNPAGPATSSEKNDNRLVDGHPPRQTATNASVMSPQTTVGTVALN